MKKAEFLREMDVLSKQFSATVFAGEIWIGRVVSERLQTQDEVTRGEVVADLNVLLAEHKTHPNFPKAILQALEKLDK